MKKIQVQDQIFFNTESIDTGYNIKKYCPKYNDINNYQWIPSKKRDLLEEGMDEPRYYYLMTLRKRRVPKIKQSLKTRNALIERYEY